MSCEAGWVPKHKSPRERAFVKEFDPDVAQPTSGEQQLKLRSSCCEPATQNLRAHRYYYGGFSLQSRLQSAISGPFLGMEGKTLRRTHSLFLQMKGPPILIHLSDGNTHGVGDIVHLELVLALPAQLHSGIAQPPKIPTVGYL